MYQVYDDHGIRFEYPEAWDSEITEEGPRTTVAVNAPNGLAFAIVTVDETSEVDPKVLADEALDALRDEYTEFNSRPVTETLDGHEAIGHDIEFTSLDLPNSCMIRCFSTPRRAILYYGQWAEFDGEADHGAELLALRHSLEETDS